jgi:hypothetical protein
MREPTPLRTSLLLIPPILLLLVSVIAFALERISYALFAAEAPFRYTDHTRTMTFYGPRYKGATQYEYIDVAILVNVAPTAAIVGLSVLGVAVAVVGACGIWELKRVEGTARHDRTWAWFVCVLQVLFAGACVGVLAYASSIQGDGWREYEDVDGMGDSQTFTRETWVCQIDRFFPLQDWATTACGVAVRSEFSQYTCNRNPTQGRIFPTGSIQSDRPHADFLCE